MSDKITKQEWIDALRSGEYEQCTVNLLQDESGDATWDYEKAASHCCLGVLSSLKEIVGYDDLAKYPSEVQCTFNPNQIFNREALLGLKIWTSPQRADISRYPSRGLVNLNDSHGIRASFDQIADVIEHLVEEVPA